MEKGIGLCITDTSDEVRAYVTVSRQRPDEIALNVRGFGITMSPTQADELANALNVCAEKVRTTKVVKEKQK